MVCTNAGSLQVMTTGLSAPPPNAWSLALESLTRQLNSGRAAARVGLPSKSARFHLRHQTPDRIFQSSSGYDHPAAGTNGGQLSARN